MSAIIPPPVTSHVQYRSQWSFPVPWARANEVRARLARVGLPATLCLHPRTREARLEPWPGVAVQLFMTALRDCLERDRLGRLRALKGHQATAAACGSAPGDRGVEAVGITLSRQSLEIEAD